MAKDQEKKLAYEYYVNQKKTAKETAQLVGVTEKTVGNWVDRWSWKQLRNAKINSKEEQLDNIREIIAILSEERIHLQRDILSEEPKENHKELESLRRRAVALSDEISKWNKALENLDRQNRISLSVYIEVMNDIFENLRAYDKTLFAKTLDFQERHLNQVSLKY